MSRQMKSLDTNWGIFTQFNPENSMYFVHKTCGEFYPVSESPESEFEKVQLAHICKVK